MSVFVKFGGLFVYGDLLCEAEALYVELVGLEPKLSFGCLLCEAEASFVDIVVA